MKRFRTCTLALATFAAVLSSGCGQQRPLFDGPARHVVLISLDTTRADHLGAYGDSPAHTPHLDALAKESILFTDFMTTAPTTLASHTSLFTGSYPHTHGVPRNGFVIPAENVLLTEILQEAGFHTMAVIGSFALAGRFGLSRGFAEYDEDFDVQVGERGADQNQRSAEKVTDAVLARIDALGKNAGGKNLFVFAHYFDPHAPYAPPLEVAKRYDPLAGQRLPSLPRIAELCRQTPNKTPAIARRIEALYAAEVDEMDRHIGRLLDGLKERGILKDALVVLTSDHGENLCDHEGYFDHGETVYQSTIRGIGMIRLPRAERAGIRIDRLVSSIDVLPTILRFLGLPLPERVEGEAIAFDESKDDATTRFSEATKPWRDIETDSRWTNALKSRAIRRGPYKLIHTPYRDEVEFYDLAADPDERENLLDGRDLDETLRGRIAEMRKDLDAWAASADPLSSRFDSEQQEDTIEKLRSLGYLQ